MLKYKFYLVEDSSIFAIVMFYMEKYEFFIREIIRKPKINSKLIKKVVRDRNKQQKSTPICTRCKQIIKSILSPKKISLQIFAFGRG